MSVKYLFVYGTLMRGMDNDHLLVPFAAKRETGWVQGKLYHLTAHGYPALILGQSQNWIQGELVEINDWDAALPVLDHLEGYQDNHHTDNVYDRKLCRVRRESGEMVDAVVYVWHNEQELSKIGEMVETGNWSRFISGRSREVLDRYYFAYGSCMDEKGRIANSGYAADFKKIGTAALDGWKICLNKRAGDDSHVYANIEPCPKSTVYGILYRISRRAERDYLNSREGYPYHYYKEYLNVRIGDQVFPSAIVYVAMPEYIDETLPVAEAYAAELRRGSLALPTEYREELEGVIHSSLRRKR